MRKVLALIITLTIFLSSSVRAEFLIDERITETPVTKGVTYTNIKRLTENGWSNLHVLKADMKEKGLDFKVLYNEELTQTSTVAQFASKAGDVVAAVNADFFTSYSGKTASEGMIIKDGELITTPSNDPSYATLVSDEENNLFTDYFTYTVKVLSKATQQSAGILFYNKLGPVEYLKVYDSNFGKTSPGSMDDGIEVVVEDGIVTSMHSNKEGVEIPENGYVLTHSLRHSTFLTDNFKEGDEVELTVLVEPSIEGIKDAVGGGTVLVKNGEIAELTIKDSRNPVTAVGYDSKNEIIYLFNADGRNDKARGMTLKETAEMFVEYGCSDAISFDGGGSTAMAIKKPDNEISHVNLQTYYRPVTNAVGITAEKKKGEFSYISLSADYERIRLNESVKLKAVLYDEYMNEIKDSAIKVKYTADKKGTFKNDEFYPKETGKVTIKASADGIENETVITVMESEKPAHYIDEFYKHTDKEGFTIGFFGDNGDYKTFFTDVVTAKRNSLAGEVDMSVFRRLPLGNIESEVKPLNYYWQKENEYGAFVALNNEKGSVYASDSTQWEKLLKFIDSTEKENIFIMMPVDIAKNDLAEAEILTDKLKEKLSDRNIFIISYGEEYKYKYDDKIRYITIRDLPPFDRTIPYETLSFCKYGLLTFNEDGISFEFVPYFK